MKLYNTFILFFFLLPIVAFTQITETYNTYTLNKNNSLLLPQFDTASIVNSDVENIILSLYVLNMGMDENTEVQLTINPINLKS